jgi:hypothetical protein
MPGQYIAAAQPGERGLFILHNGGRVLRMVGAGDELGPTHVADPRTLAQNLFASGKWDRVHVIDKQHLAHVAREAQREPRRELTLDAYYNLVHRLVWDGSDGYVSIPPRPEDWNGWTYSGLRSFVAGLASPSALGLCVIDAPTVQIGLAARVENGRVNRITTLEGLPGFAAQPAVDQAFFDEFWSALQTHVAPPAAALVLTPEAFETWLTASDKAAVLEAAARNGEALVRGA